MAVLTSSSPAAVDEREPVTRRRATTLALIGLLGGVVLATVWSFELVDSVIGANVRPRRHVHRLQHRRLRRAAGHRR
jgi:hypothetical protein